MKCLGLILFLLVIIVIFVVFCNKKEKFTIYENCPPKWKYNFEDKYKDTYKKWITPVYMDMYGCDGNIDKNIEWWASATQFWPNFRGWGNNILYKYNSCLWP